MRLLHTATLKLEEFSANRIPPYAIISHTWEETEVTFQDMRWDLTEKMTGYEKIKNACLTAVACGFEYVWLDTCCIDKTSSAELSEAIDLMFHWYREAEACFAYLADLPSSPSHESVTDNSDDALSARIKSDFSKCRWFTRGWTLQELIAAPIVIFLDEKWEMVGTKSSLKQTISDITGIPVGILLGDDLQGASIAQKMSWVSRRETTRFEDIAYCLMGLFDIHMPLLYGEGERAFIRLQEEIMKVSDDYSLFACRSPSGPKLTDENYNGLLATSPAVFIHSHNIVRFKIFNTFRALNGL
ncbi:heterokaryon incompatibility protein-domain-containing protein [Xylogone sp. PMI_703]|nr:heterokaryon incompatibility protein-domain-containing protein [Xylogone sp. PMI_703]